MKRKPPKSFYVKPTAAAAAAATILLQCLVWWQWQQRSVHPSSCQLSSLARRSRTAEHLALIAAVTGAAQQVAPQEITDLTGAAVTTKGLRMSSPGRLPAQQADTCMLLQLWRWAETLLSPVVKVAFSPSFGLLVQQ